MAVRNPANHHLEHILEKACILQDLTDQEVACLLGVHRRDDLDKLFKAARTLRERFFGKKFFLYGFIYFSTWCRNDCTFCYYRKSNSESMRYRKTTEEVLDAATRLAASGVHLIDLTLGEDPHFHNREHGFQPLVDLVHRVKERTGLPIMISPGVVPGHVLQDLAAAGADWYACYQETHNKRLFEKLRLKQSYERRFASKEEAIRCGLLVEEGILAGVGETAGDIILSLQGMRRLKAQQVRVMSFVPQQGTPLAGRQTPSRLWELKIIAVMRILFPDRLIPASLDVDGIAGLRERINAGANVITSIIPPLMGLAGVAQCKRDIDEGNRTVPGVLPFLEDMGLAAATAEEYRNWVDGEKAKLQAVQCRSYPRQSSQNNVSLNQKRIPAYYVEKE